MNRNSSQAPEESGPDASYPGKESEHKQETEEHEETKSVNQGQSRQHATGMYVSLTTLEAEAAKNYLPETYILVERNKLKQRGIKMAGRGNNQAKRQAKNKYTIKPRTKRKSKKNNKSDYIDPEYLEHYDSIDVPRNSAPKLEARISKNEDKLLPDLGLKDDHDSGTSDTKKNMEQSVKNTAMMASNQLDQPNLSEASHSKDILESGRKPIDTDELRTFPIGIDPRVIGKNDGGASYSGDSQPQRHDLASQNDYSEKDGSSHAVFSSSQKLDPNMKPSRQSAVSNGDYINEFDNLQNDLYRYELKCQNVMLKLNECMHTSQMKSIDKKVDLIKHSWLKLNPKNQKYLKTLMKNQFNIDLNDFHLDPQEQILAGKLSLMYVRPSIIESLYQEIDMLSCCMYLQDVYKQAPAVPLDDNIQLTISQFNPRTTKEKRKEKERFLEHSQPAHFSFNNNSFPQEHGYPNFSSQAGMVAGLNYMSSQLNQSTRHQDSYL